MNKLYKVLGLLGVLVLLSACKPTIDVSKEEVVDDTIVTEENQEDTEVESEEAPEEAEEAEASEVEDETEEAEVKEEIEEVVLDENVALEIDAFLESGNLSELYSYIGQAAMTANTPTMDYMIEKYLTLANEQVYIASDPFFTETGYEVQTDIYEVFDKNPGVISKQYLIVGQDKATLLDLVNDQSKLLLQEVFEQGYGLLSLEGSYYVVVDYVELADQYSMKVGEITKEFLQITSSILVNQTTVEEYLSITPVELMERSLQIEAFFMNYTDAPAPYRDMLKWELSTCIYKLSAPSPFDGGVNEDGTLSTKYVSIYDSIISDGPDSIVRDVAQGITQWVDERDGYVGTYEDMEDLYEVSSMLYQDARERMMSAYGLDFGY